MSPNIRSSSSSLFSPKTRRFSTTTLPVSRKHRHQPNSCYISSLQSQPPYWRKSMTPYCAPQSSQRTSISMNKLTSPSVIRPVDGNRSKLPSVSERSQEVGCRCPLHIDTGVSRNGVFRDSQRTIRWYRRPPLCERRGPACSPP